MKKQHREAIFRAFAGVTSKGAIGQSMALDKRYDEETLALAAREARDAVDELDRVLGDSESGIVSVERPPTKKKPRAKRQKRKKPELTEAEWREVERLMGQSLRHGGVLDTRLLERALDEDPTRYRLLHERVKIEETRRVNPLAK